MKRTSITAPVSSEKQDKIVGDRFQLRIALAGVLLLITAGIWQLISADRLRTEAANILVLREQFARLEQSLDDMRKWPLKDRRILSAEVLEGFWKQFYSDYKESKKALESEKEFAGIPLNISEIVERIDSAVVQADEIRKNLIVSRPFSEEEGALKYEFDEKVGQAVDETKSAMQILRKSNNRLLEAIVRQETFWVFIILSSLVLTVLFVYLSRKHKLEILNRIQVENTLIETSRNLSELIRQSPLAIFALDVEGRITVWNPAAERMFGWGEDEVAGSLNPTIPLDKLDEFQALRGETLQGKYFTSLEMVKQKKDGSKFYASFSKAPVYDFNGNVNGTLVLASDITDRKRAEDEIRLIQEIILEVAETEGMDSALKLFLQRVCEDAGWVLGESWVPNRDKTSLELGLGWYGGFENAKNFRAISKRYSFLPGQGLPGRIWSSKQSIWIRDLNMEQYFMRAGIAADFSLRSAVGVPLLANNEVVAVCVFFMSELRDRDERLLKLISTIAAQIGSVIRRKQAEDALRVSEEDYKALYENAPIGIYRTTSEGDILMSNPALVKMLGYSEFSELAARNLEKDGYEGGYSRDSFKRRLERDGEIIGLESRWVKKDGATIFVRENARAVRAKDGAVLYYEGTIEDITQSKLTGELLAKQNRILEMIAGGDAFLEVLESAAQILEEQIDGAVGSILLLEQDGKNMRLRHGAAPSLPLEYTQAVDGVIIGPAVGSCGTAAFRKELVVVSDIENDPLWSNYRDLALKHGLRACWSMPILSGERNVLGTFAVYYSEPRRPNPQNLELVETLANLVKIAIERKNADESLRQSEEYFRSLIENASDIISLVDEDGKILYGSHSAERLLGYKAYELLYKSIEEFIHPDDVQDFSGILKSVETGDNRIAEFRFRHKEGTWRFLESVVNNLLEDPSVEAVVINSRDVTERKLAEKERARLADIIQKAYLEWTLTFDAVETPILILDFEGCVSRINKASKALLGKSYLEVVGQPIAGLGAHQPWLKIVELVNAVLENQVPANCQIQDELNNKTWRIAVNSATYSDYKRIIVFVMDITNMAKLQESLRRSQLMSAMGSLVAGVAHEVRNPLFAVLATLDAFEAEFGENAEHERYIEVLRKELNRMVRLMQDLLEYGKPINLEISEAAIETVIDEAIQHCRLPAHKSDVAIKEFFNNGSGVLLMDRKRMIQVFKNLIENAVQHSPRNGTVAVHMEEASIDDVVWIKCMVKDSGPGFRKADIPKLFEPFFTRRKGGTGLGLSIVQRVVEEHGGKIIASNDPEGGAVMTVLLPPARNATNRGSLAEEFTPDAP